MNRSIPALTRTTTRQPPRGALAQPWDMLGFVVVAVLVAIVNRRSMLSREAASTDVLLTADASAHQGRAPRRT